jgi:hypothetical protein
MNKYAFGWCLVLFIGACGESSEAPPHSSNTGGSSSGTGGTQGSGGSQGTGGDTQGSGGAGVGGSGGDQGYDDASAGSGGASGSGGAGEAGGPDGQAPMGDGGTTTEKTEIKVLIVDGFNNHTWQTVTARYLTILGRDPIFKTTVSTVPALDDPKWSAWKPDFGAYDVIVQNTTDIGGTKGAWPKETQVAFEKYMADGGRMLTHHAANHGFASWVEYNKMIAIAWRPVSYGSAVSVHEDGTITLIPPGTGLGAHHDYRGDALIHQVNNHPIYQGLPKEWMAETIEVIQYMRGPAQNITVLSYDYDVVSKLNFPTSWLVQYGKGVVYNSNYGHTKDPVGSIPESMRCAAFETIHERAIRWLGGLTKMPPVPADFPTATMTSVRAP